MLTCRLGWFGREGVGGSFCAGGGGNYGLLMGKRLAQERGLQLETAACGFAEPPPPQARALGVGVDL